MVAYSFKARFIEPMLAGIKDGTIRADRRHPSRHARVGDPMTNYVGLRTKRAALILDTYCTASLPVTLVWRPSIEIVVDGEKLGLGLLDAFAVRDGFADMDDMAGFWRQTHGDLARFDGGRLMRWQRPPFRVEMGGRVSRPGEGLP